MPKSVKPIATPPTVPPKRKRKPMGLASYVEFQTEVRTYAMSVEQLNEWGLEGWELAGFAIRAASFAVPCFYYVFQRHT